MSDEEYDKEHHLDDDVMFIHYPWLEFKRFWPMSDITLTGYDYIFLHENKLKW